MSTINPLVLLEGKDDPSYGPIPRPGMARYMDEALPPSKRLNWRANGTLVPPLEDPWYPYLVHTTVRGQLDFG